MAELKEWLTVGEAAEYLKSAKITVYRLLERRQLNAAKLGKAWRIRRDDIDEYLEGKKSSIKSDQRNTTAATTIITATPSAVEAELSEFKAAIQHYTQELNSAVKLMSIIKNRPVALAEVYNLALEMGLAAMQNRYHEEAAERNRLHILAKQGRTLKYRECTNCIFGSASATSHLPTGACSREQEHYLAYTGTSLNKCPFWEKGGNS